MNSHGHHPHFNSSIRVHPILKWAGGKSALLPQLIAHFPTDFKRYIEPFFGGGAVFFALKNNTPALLNEANPELVNLYNVLAHHPQSLMNQRDILSLQYSEEYYYQLRAQKPLCPIEQAARTLFLNKTGFNGLYRQNAKGGFNVPFGKKRECPRLYNKGNLMAASVRLNAATLSNADFEWALNAAGAGDFVYCDPPYQPLNPTSSFTGYTAAGFTQADQRRLKEACALAVQRGARVAVSNSAAPSILELYKDFSIVPISAKRAINSKGHLRGPIGEVLVMMGG